MAVDWKIEGKIFLITGGASGLGAAYAETFLQNGAEKIAILDVAENVGKELVATLNKTHKDKVIFIKCDVSRGDEIENAFQQVLAAFERIDVIVNNAGVMNDSPDVWRTASDVNWQGLLSFTKKGINHMRKDEGGLGGTIINVSSTAAFVKLGFLPIYSGSKAAVLHFARSIATPEFNDETGIRLLTICFGPTATPLLSNLETKSFEIKMLTRSVAASDYHEQRVECAVDAMLKMYREAVTSSVWLSTHHLPGRDITAILDEASASLAKLLLPDFRQ